MAKKPGSTDRLSASWATVDGVGRFAPDSQAATAVGLLSTLAARSLLRRPARCRARVSRAPSKRAAASVARSTGGVCELTAHRWRRHAVLPAGAAGAPEHPAPCP